MSETEKLGIGSIAWTDLTVENAEEVKAFYSEVVGWDAAPHDMGDYHDFDIISPGSGKVVTGICYARGVNANIPPVWMIYIAVDDVAGSAKRCVELGGKLIDGPRLMGGKPFCVIQDPAGAVAALISD